jgi:hypothetical protein
MISPVALLRSKIEKQRQQDMRKFLASQAMAKSAALNKLRQEYAQAKRELHIDRDFDGIPDVEEYMYGTNPHTADSDWDGRSDLEEVSSALNPRIDDEQEDDDDLERQR